MDDEEQDLEIDDSILDESPIEDSDVPEIEDRKPQKEQPKPIKESQSKSAVSGDPVERSAYFSAVSVPAASEENEADEAAAESVFESVASASLMKKVDDELFSDDKHSIISGISGYLPWSNSVTWSAALPKSSIRPANEQPAEQPQLSEVSFAESENVLVVDMRVSGTEIQVGHNLPSVTFKSLLREMPQRKQPPVLHRIRALR
jgi:hypothetical protein